MKNYDGRWFAPMTMVRMMESALDAVPSGVLLVDEDGLIRYANEAALEGFGWKYLVGVPLEELVPETSREKHKAGYEGFLRSPAAEGPVRVDGLHRDGSHIPVQVGVSYARVDGLFVVTCSVEFLGDER